MVVEHLKKVVVGGLEEDGLGGLQVELVWQVMREEEEEEHVRKVVVWGEEGGIKEYAEKVGSLESGAKSQL